MLSALIGFGLSCWLTIYNTELIIQVDRDDLNNEIIAIPGLLAVEAFLLIGEFTINNLNYNRIFSFVYFINYCMDSWQFQL